MVLFQEKKNKNKKIFMLIVILTTNRNRYYKTVNLEFIIFIIKSVFNFKQYFNIRVRFFYLLKHYGYIYKNDFFFK